MQCGKEQRAIWGSWSLPLILAWTFLAICFLVPRAKAKSNSCHNRSLGKDDTSDINNISSSTSEQYFKTANEKEILDFLVNKSCYDSRVHPLLGSKNTTIVDVSVLVLSLSSPDESSLLYEVEYLLQLSWRDHRLKYDNRSERPYLSALQHMNSIWMPDILFIKHGTFKQPQPQDPEHVTLKIFKNGTVIYTRRMDLKLTCKGDLNTFPFDDPNCKFAMESKSNEQHDVLMRWKQENNSCHGEKLPEIENLKKLNAYPIFNKTGDCDQNMTYAWRGNFSCLQVELIFTRDDIFYYSTVFAPSIILVTSSFITFWLEWNAVPARVMIGVTTMLNFFTTSNSFRSSLPGVSNLSAMNLWDSVCIAFIYASLLEFVFVNYRGRKRPLQDMRYMPGENYMVHLLTENRHRIPQAIHRIGLSLRDYFMDRGRSNNTMEGSGPSGGGVPGVATSKDDDLEPENLNSNEHVSCANCGHSQCSQSNVPNSCTNGEDQNEVEYTFNKTQSVKRRAHPIRVAKSIDVLARVVFPLSYTIFLIFFFVKYKVMSSSTYGTKCSTTS